ncbi:hypothetical protein [Treponema pallidum]
MPARGRPSSSSDFCLYGMAVVNVFCVQDIPYGSRVVLPGRMRSSSAGA